MVLTTIIVGALAGTGLTQEKPLDIPKTELPAKAECLLCDGHGLEKPVGGVRYKGKTYFFCNSKEIAEFKKDPEAHVPPVLPRPMPPFDLADELGGNWNAGAMTGKLVLIDFWATWCGPCKEMFPTLEKLHAAYAPRGFEILSVSIDEKRPDLDKFLKSKKFPNPVLHDTKQTWAAWGVRSIPAVFLVKDGQVIAQWKGKAKRESLEAAIKGNLPK